MHLISDNHPPLLFNRDFSFPLLPNQYIEWLAKDYSPETVRVYVSHLRAWLEYCEEKGIDWLHVTERCLRTYKATLSSELRAKNYHISRISGFYDFVGWQGVPNPIARLTHPKNILIKRTNPYVLDFDPIPEEKVMRFIGALPSQRDRIMALLMYLCGLRRAEVVNLTRELLNGAVEDGMVRYTVVGKGDKKRTLKMTGDLRDAIAAFAATHACEFLFPAWGHQMHVGTINAAFSIARKATEIPIHPHLLRHLYSTDRSDTLAQEMAVSGSMFSNPLKILQAELGHSSIATTSVYIHLKDRNAGTKSLCDGQRAKLERASLRRILL